MQYSIGSPEAARAFILSHVNPGQRMTTTTSWHGLGPDAHPGEATPTRAVVLVGDSVTWYEGVGMGENGGTAIFSPDPKSWALSPWTTVPPAAIDRFTLTPIPDPGEACSPNPPANLNGNLINAWCYGPLVYTVAIENVTADDNQIQWSAFPYDWSGVLAPRDPHEVPLTGPKNDTPGRSDSAAEGVVVLDPKLELEKQVCINALAADCDPTNDSLWVKSQELPAGSTQATFRIVVTNAGNVRLDNVHIAQDVVVPVTADASKVGNANVAGNPSQLVNETVVVADSLEPGESSVPLVVTVPINGVLAGKLKNTATANAELPDFVHDPFDPVGVDSDPTVSPDGKRLAERFTGNPTAGDPTGEPQMVPSNIDEAEVFEQVPGIALEKFVCKAGTGCQEPTEAELAELGAGNETDEWVKATTVPFETDAQWLLVITNTGVTVLTDVTLSREDLDEGGLGHDGTLDGCEAGTNVGTLQPGQTTTLMCSTGMITNEAAIGSGDDVINTAAVCGDPSDMDGVKLPGPNGQGTQPAVCSGEKIAEVNTLLEEEETPPATTTPPPTTQPASTPPAKTPPLGGTGANAVLAAVLGLLMLAGGGALVAVRVRRARQEG